jgi:c(7)-type cytochrome triheme protein
MRSNAHISGKSASGKASGAMKANRKMVMTALLLAIGASVTLAQTFGVKKRVPKPDEFGDVRMNNFSEASKTAPVVFRHWSHRALYTCRLCHIDLGFAMKAGGTGVKEEDNTNGLYCGACHNGKEAFVESPKHRETCVRCHAAGKEGSAAKDFAELVRGYPPARFGNKVDWLKAEQRGLIHLKDHLEGISIKRKPLKGPADEQIQAAVAGMPDIIFSHDKHAVWNGCELCHPDIFGVKKGSTGYTMQDIFDGRYCGACHGKVAFSNLDCPLCHSKEVS